MSLPILSMWYVINASSGTVAHLRVHLILKIINYTSSFVNWYIFALYGADLEAISEGHTCCVR